MMNDSYDSESIPFAIATARSPRTRRDRSALTVKRVASSARISLAIEIEIEIEMIVDGLQPREFRSRSAGD